MPRDGAHALIDAMLAAGVDTCFTNPGTSEIQFVAALDSAPAMRAVLTLFEGVAAGAADGYARMTDAPAATLLHLGPGLANGLANLHNARRARVPLLNLVGDQATHHVSHDAPLQSDIETVARNVSSWVRTSTRADRLAADAADAVAAAVGPPRQVATLIVPADVAWEPAPSRSGTAPVRHRPAATDTGPGADAGFPPPEAIDAIAAALRGGGRTGLLLGGRALREPGLIAASRIAAATGASVFAEMFPARLQRGAGRPAPTRLLYWPELAAAQLQGLRRLILVDAPPPVSFFAYPGRPSSLVPSGCEVHTLAARDGDGVAALEQLGEALGASAAVPAVVPPSTPPPPRGPLTARAVCELVGASLPEDAIVSDEAITSGTALPAATAGAPAHDWLTLTGGAIGQGLPVAVGAAIACPDRPVLALQADGSAMYTIQALWTMAREGLDVTVVLFANRGYNILATELARAGVPAAGAAAGSQLALAEPDLDFVALASGLGVPATRARTVEAFAGALHRALAEAGPHLIEAVVPAEAPPAAIL